MDAKRYKNRSPWWIVLGSTLGLIFSTGPLVQFTFGVFVEPVSEAFRTDRGKVSLALFASLALSGLFTPLAGRLADRYGVRRFGIPMIVLFALSFALVGFGAASVWQFIALYALVGIFGAGQTPLIYGKAIATAFDARRGLALGIAMAGVGVGTAAIPYVAQQLVKTIGWQDTYVVLGLATLLVAPPAVALFLHDPPAVRASSGAAPLPPPGLTGIEALRTGVFWKLMVAFFAVAVASAGVMAHIVPMITDRGVAASTATLAVSAGGVALICGRLVAGYLLDHLFAPHVALLFFAMPLLGAVILATTVSLGFALLATVLVGIGLGAEFDLIAYLQSRYLGLRSFGEIYGYFLALFLVGSGLGPFLMGQAFARWGSYEIALIAFAVALGAVCTGLLSLGPYAFGPKAEAQ